MEEREFAKTDQKVYCEVLDNGLRVYLMPNSNVKNYHLNFGVLFGSNDIEFIPYGKTNYVKMPLGIAHFLEHKTFEVESLEDPFSHYAKDGAICNAGTAYYSTRYYVIGNKNIYNNLDFLISFVLSPHFTTKGINKEKGIIAEEIRMYEDDPTWILSDRARYNIFEKFPIREKISGIEETIQEITKEMLYDCYNTFYQPSNMVLIVNGNFDVKKMSEIIHNNKILKNAPSNKSITRKIYQEPNTVVTKYTELQGNVILPKLRYTFKINKDIFSLKDSVSLNMYLNSIFTIIFGTSGLFSEQVKEKGITTGYYIDHGYYHNFYTLDIEAESEHPHVFKEYVDKALKNIEISESEFERTKRVWIASEVRISDNLEILSDSVLDDIIKYGEPCFNRIDLIRKLDINTLNQVIKELDFSNNNFVLINPKEKEHN